MMLALESVSVRNPSGDYRVRDVSLTINAGEMLAVLGPNGAGKSTLVALLSGSLTPDQGRVTLDGVNIATMASADLARRRAVLPQENTLSFRFDVEAVVGLGRSPYAGCGRVADQQAITCAMQSADVLNLADRDYLSLSGGERQRVHLARVLAQLDDGTLPPNGSRPGTTRSGRYLLLDEPTSALDLAHQHSVLTLARELRRNASVGVLAILHDPNLAALHADRIAVVDKGTLFAVGSPSDVLNEALFQSVFQLPVTVTPHPCHPDRPLIIARRAETSELYSLATHAPLVECGTAKC